MLPHLVLIDDSEAILAFEQAVLSSHYAISTATDGAQGLTKIRAAKPAGVLLDLSMPGMSGEDVLREIKADPMLRDIPVVIVSSERTRGEACLAAGAAGFLAKPIRAEDLVAIVDQALEAARSRRAHEGIAILPVLVGPFEVGIPLELVRMVTWQTAMIALPSGPAYVSELCEIHGEAVCVLDLPTRLGVDHAASVVERKLVVIDDGTMKLALCVDGVRDPAELSASELAPVVEAVSAEGVVALARTPRGAVPVIQPHALLSRGVRLHLEDLVRRRVRETTPP
jgi:CheY-like chemotaxis protein/chemotaxis signal transduction protein